MEWFLDDTKELLLIVLDVKNDQVLCYETVYI